MARLDAYSSTTYIELSPTLSSLISVTGTATLGGTLHIIADSGTYASSQTYTILTAAGFGGTVFDALEIPTNFIGSVSYTATAVNLLLQLQTSSLPVANLSGNANSMGSYLNTFQNNPAYQSILRSLNSLPTNELEVALSSISPAREASATYASTTNGFTVAGTVASHISGQRSLQIRGTSGLTSIAAEELLQEDRLFALDEREPSNSDSNQIPSDPEQIEQMEQPSRNRPAGSIQRAAAQLQNHNCWLKGFGDFAYQESQDQIPAFHSNTGGFLIGYDYYGFSIGSIGSTVGYSRNNIRNADDFGTVTIDTYFFGPYGTIYFYNAYTELGAFFAANQIHNSRHVFFTGFDANAISLHNSYQLMPHFGCGYDWMFSWGYLEPYAILDYVANWEDAYSEHGAEPLNIAAQSRFSSMLRTEIGLQAYEELTKSWGRCIFKEKAAYVNKAPFNIGLMTAAFVGASDSFTVDAFTAVQNLFMGGFEVLIRGNNGFFGSLEYDGEVGSGYHSNQVQAVFGYYF